MDSLVTPAQVALDAAQTHQPSSEDQHTIARRAFGGLVIHLNAADSPWNEHQLALFVRGQLIPAQHATLQLLYCLLEQPGHIFGYAQLCRALGLRGGNPKRDKGTLVEHARRCRTLLDEENLPVCITLAKGVGYALCRKALSPKQAC